MKSKVDKFINEVIDQIIKERPVVNQPKIEPMLCNVNQIAQHYIKGGAK